MLALQNINLTLGKNTSLQRSILNNLNLQLSPGEFAVVIGGNGAGKSTLLSVISGFVKPDTGKIIIDQQDVTHTTQAKRAKSIAKVMQDPRVGTMENLTVLENMAFAYKRGALRSLLPFANQQRRKLFSAKLAELNMGLENRLDEPVVNLSGGQRQALSLIMALLADCKILLLDEITAALDPNAAQQVVQLAAKIVRAEQRTCIMITHNMQHALQYADSIWVLKDGKFVKSFAAAEKLSLTPADLSSALM